MIPFVTPTMGRATSSGSTIQNKRQPAGDMQSGSDRRILAGDAYVAGEYRVTTETL